MGGGSGCGGFRHVGGWELASRRRDVSCIHSPWQGDAMSGSKQHNGKHMQTKSRTLLRYYLDQNVFVAAKHDLTFGCIGAGICFHALP